MATSRAAALLESLSGREADFEGPRRWTLFSREGSQRGIRARRPPHHEAEVVNAPDSTHPTPLRFSNALTLVAAIALIVAAVAGWRLLSRPAPLEERMPQVQAADVAAVETMLGQSADQPAGVIQSTTSAKGRASPTSGDSGSAITESPSRIAVHVAGAVVSPGVVELPGDSRVVDAVAAAGGLRSDADPDRLNLASVLADGVRIVVPVKGVDPLTEVPIEMPPPTGSPGTTPKTVSGGTGSLVDVNRATAEELQKLPGVGPATSAAIIAKREKDGPFETVDSLIEVRGIGEAKLEAIRDMVTVG